MKYYIIPETAVKNITSYFTNDLDKLQVIYAEPKWVKCFTKEELLKRLQGGGEQ